MINVPPNVTFFLFIKQTRPAKANAVTSEGEKFSMIQTPLLSSATIEFLFTKGNSTGPFVKVCRSSRHCETTFAALNPKVLDIEPWTKVSQEKNLYTSVPHECNCSRWRLFWPEDYERGLARNRGGFARSWRTSKWDVKTRKGVRGETNLKINSRSDLALLPQTTALVNPARGPCKKAGD